MKWNRLSEHLKTGEKVLILSERVKKKDTQVKFYKGYMENRPFFQKDQIDIVGKRKKINDAFYYWISKRSLSKLFKRDFRKKNIISL